MNYIKMGQATVNFYAGLEPANVHVASNYRKRKPTLWEEEDLYIATNRAGEVTLDSVNADEITVNGKKEENKKRINLTEATTKISVKSDGTEYNATVYIVQADESACEESSSGILYEDGEFFFDAAGFLDGLTSLFASNYEETYDEISIEGEIPETVPTQTHQCCGGGCHLSSLGASDFSPAKADPVPSYQATEQSQQLQIDSQPACSSSDSGPSSCDPGPSSSSHDTTSSSSSSYSSYDSSSSSSSSSSYDSSSSYSSYDSGSSSSSSCDSGGW